MRRSQTPSRHSFLKSNAGFIAHQAKRGLRRRFFSFIILFALILCAGSEVVSPLLLDSVSAGDSTATANASNIGSAIVLQANTVRRPVFPKASVLTFTAIPTRRWKVDTNLLSGS